MTYVMSDIHGHLQRFESIMDQIKLGEGDHLFVLGDVIDRHPHGISILLQLMAMLNVKMLLGNHEYMMLRALGRPYDGYADNGTALDHWYRNGGKVTTDENDANPRENRYLQLLNKVIRKGVKTKVLMLSATPKTRRFSVLFSLRQ